MITIIDYGMGNLGSIRNMLKKIGQPSVTSSDIATIEEADKLILPGVGAFDRAMHNLEHLGLISVIKRRAKEGIPLLGICLGMQLLADHSEEGDVNGLGIIPGNVKKFKLPEGYKVPHMGWNIVDVKHDNPLFRGFETFGESRFYFVHSYHYICTAPENSIGMTPYGYAFTSVVSHQNVYGVQFHPEKSHKFGMKLFENFIAI